MKKTAIATLVIAALGTFTAPLALAQSGGYLNHRQSIDSLENINSVYQGVESARKARITWPSVRTSIS